MPDKTPRYSMTEKTELVLPQHANVVGSAFGGTVMSWIDIVAAVSAQRHVGRVAVTASVDSLDFLAPLRVGDIVRLHAQVNAVFRSSMEIEVRVEREDPADMSRTLCVQSFLTFVNLDRDGKPAPIRPLVLETEEDEARAAAAQKRRAARLERKRANR